MRLCWISITLSFALLSPVVAQDTRISAPGSMHGVGSARTQLRSPSDIEGRGSLRIPARGGGAERSVGANFDARGGTRISASQHRDRVSDSHAAHASAQLRRRALREEARQSTDHSDAPVREFDGDRALEVNRHVLRADLRLAHRLAEIDRLRDHALANDDVDLLMRADVLEQQARVHHQQHVDQMRFAAEQGRGQKIGFWVDGPTEFDAQADQRFDSPPEARISSEVDGQFPASGAAYEELETTTDDGGEGQNVKRAAKKPLRWPFPRFRPGIDPAQKGAIRNESSAGDVNPAASFEQEQEERPAPRRTRVVEQPGEGASDEASAADGPVRAASSDS